MLGVWQGSAAQQAQEMVPDGVRVVSALHTVSASSLRDLDHELDEDVLVCGDRKADKQRVMALIDQIDGLRCVDCGRLEMARIVEGLTPLLIGDQRPLQDPRRHPRSRACRPMSRRGRSSSWPAEPAAPSSPAACSTSSATTSS